MMEHTTIPLLFLECLVASLSALFIVEIIVPPDNHNNKEMRIKILCFIEFCVSLMFLRKILYLVDFVSDTVFMQYFCTVSTFGGTVLKANL